MNELVTDEVTDEDRETAAPPQPKRAAPKAKRARTTTTVTTPTTMPTHHHSLIVFASRERAGGPLPETPARGVVPGADHDAGIRRGVINWAARLARREQERHVLSAPTPLAS